MTTSPRRTLIQRLLALQRAGEAVTAAPTAPEAATAAAWQFVTGYEAALARVWQYDETQAELVLIAAAPIAAFAAEAPGRIAASAGRAGRIVTARRAEVTASLARRPALYDPPESQYHRLSSYAGFPLLSGGRLYGVFESYLSEAIKAEEIEPLATFARQLAAVMAKAQLNEAAGVELARAKTAAVGQGQTSSAAGPRTGSAEACDAPLPSEWQARLNQELQEIVQIASHDLRSPILSIGGYLTQLEQELAGRQTVRSAYCLERIRANTEHLHKVASILLDESRPAGGVNLSEPVYCAEIVAALGQELRPWLDKVGGALVVQSQLPVVQGSRLRLRQVFSNLFNNAINYRDPARPLLIEVGSRERAGEFEFYVRDNGVGINSSDFERIFQPLTRLGVTRAEGTGLGLYIVRQAVGEHGGRVWLQSQEGKGTTFYFTLPAQPRT